MSRPVGTTHSRCKRGHDLTAPNARLQSRGCRICENMRRRGKGHGKVVQPERVWFPRIMGIAGGKTVAIDLYAAYRGIDQRSAERCYDRRTKEGWVLIDTADRWCIAIGSHLALVYPELYVTERLKGTA